MKCVWWLLWFAGCVGWSAVAAAQTITYYEGELTVGDLVVEIGLHLDDDGDVAVVDLVSHWTLGVEVDAARDGERLSLTLPNGLGELTGVVSADRVLGTVARPEGRGGILELAARQYPLVVTESVTINGDGVQLGATLGMPVGDGPFPALVFVHGAGDSSRARAGTRFLAEYLPRYGIGCLVYDKRGCGQSGGDWREVGFGARAGDVRGAVAWLRQDPRVDSDHVGLYAGSQGSWVAGMAAALDPGIAFVVHHSGAVVSVREADDYAVRSRLQRDGLSGSAIEEHLALRGLELATLQSRGAREHDAFLLALAQARQRPWFAQAPYEPAAADEWWVSWYPRVVDHDPRPYLRQAECPMLWLYGAVDTESDPVRNLSILAGMARDEGKPYTIHSFPDAGHAIMVPAASAESGGLMTMAPGYFDLLIRWIRRVCGATR